MADQPPQPKRPQTSDLSGQARKKVKVHHARHIATQALEQVPTSSHAELPQFLSVEKFVKSRAFEIRAMQDALKSVRQASGQRAFQTLPRHLRRRSASHHARRVPTRLRSKARFEMKNDKPKTPSRSVKRKLKFKAYREKNRTKRWKSRQGEKKWLRTHIWHSKRTKMTDIWGFRLAKTPTQKCFRSTYRAARHGFTLHDLSYYAHLTLEAHEEDFLHAFTKIRDPMGIDPCSIRYRLGQRAAEFMVYECEEWPRRLIGQVSIAWCPIGHDKTLHSTLDVDQVTNAQVVTQRDPRTILVQAHPSLKVPIMSALVKASASKIKIHDSTELGCLELGGPSSTEVIGRVLEGETSQEKEQVMKCLRAGLKPAVFPVGMIIGMTVDDPRIYFPPKRRQRLQNCAQFAIEAVQPQVLYARCVKFWDLNQRQKKMTFKKADIDKRRSQLPIPGSALAKNDSDDQVSCLLIRTLLGWRMILPFHWTQAFFHSFIFASARLVCLDQRAQIDFEAGKPSFPQDFPCLEPAIELAARDGEQESERWKRRPPAKRVNFKLMDKRGGGGGDPFIADWKLLVGHQVAPGPGCQHVAQDVEKTEEVVGSEGPWLLLGPLVRLIVEKVVDLTTSHAQKEPLANLRRVAPQLITGVISRMQSRVKGGQSQAPYHVGWEKALVQVKMVPTGGEGKAGVIHNLARMYWNKNKEAYGNSAHVELDTEAQQELVGFVTTGQYSLKEASSVAFGAISLTKLIDMIMMKVYCQANSSGAKHVQSDLTKIDLPINYRNKNKVEHESAKLTWVA